METTFDTTRRTLRALVLDGDGAALDELARALEARSCSVLSAGDGTTGLALLLDALLHLDVLVVDLDLPGRDARSFADLVRRAGGERDLAIVVLAPRATPEVRAELIALGVDRIVDRSGGPVAAADAIVDVVMTRGSPSGGHADATDAVAPPPSVSAMWGFVTGRWSLLPA